MGIILSANTSQFISDLPLLSGTTFSAGTTELLAPVGGFTTEELRASADLQAKITSGDVVLLTDGSKVISSTSVGINYFTTYGGNFNGNINVDGVITSGGTSLSNIFSPIGSMDNYTTGTTLVGDTAYFDRSDTLSAYTLDLSSLDVNDTFVTGATYSNKLLKLTRNDDVDVDVTINAGNSNSNSLLSTGVLTGGTLSVNTTTSINIAAGSGLIIDSHTDPENTVINEITWSAKTGVNIDVTAATTTEIFIDINGNPVTNFNSANPSSPIDKRDKIYLGRANHGNALINSTGNYPSFVISPMKQFEDFALSLGTFSIVGNTISEVSGTLKIQKSIGDVYSYAANYVNDRANPSIITTGLLSGSTLVYCTRDTLSGPTSPNIDPNQYDLNGTLTTLGNNKFAAHRILHAAPNNTLIFQYGQTEYNLASDALNAISSEGYIVNDTFSNISTVYVLAVLIVEKGATDLSNAVIVQMGNIGGGGGGGGGASETLQSVYNASNPPSIVIDSTRNEFELISGVNDDSKLLSFKSTGGTETAFIQADGLASFLTLSSATPTIYYGDGSNLTGIPDNYTTGTTLVGTTLYFDRNDVLSAYTADLSSFVSDTNTFVTGGTFSNNTLSLIRNDDVDIDVTIDTFTGLTVNGDISATSISATTISGVTFYGDGSNLTGISTVDNYATGSTVIGSTAYFDRTDTLSAFTLDLSVLTGSGQNNTASNVGGGTGVFSGKSGVDLQFKSLTSTGATVTIVDGGSTINLESAAGGGESNTASNVGVGEGLYKQKTGVDLEFKSISGGTNVTITTGDTLVINVDATTPKIKSGIVSGGSFSGNPDKTTVTFTTAFVDNNYSVTVTGEDSRSWTIESKSNTGFVINSNSNIPLSNNTFWQAISVGEN